MEVPVAPGGVGIYQATVNSYPENLLYDPLFTLNNTGASGAPIPWLAASYAVNPNAQVWTINLRQGVTFSDGTQFNASTVKTDIENVIFANTNLANFSPVIPYINGSEAYLKSNHTSADRSQLASTDGITVLSQYALQISLTAPKADLLTYFTGILDTYTDVSPTGIQANGGITNSVGSTYLISHSIGSGPYILSNYDPATGNLVFTANPHWWAISAMGVKQPFEEVTMNVVSSVSSQELDLRTGVANIIQMPLTNVFDFANRTLWVSSQKLSSDVSGVSVYGPFISPQFYVLALNYQIHNLDGTLAKIQPFQNQHLVAAINEAWNASQFIQLDLNGFGVANPGVMEQGQIGYQNFQRPYVYNLTEAKLNIQAACQSLGCSPSNPLQILFIGGNDQTSELAGSLLTSNVNSLGAGVVLNFQPLSSSGKITDVLARTEGIEIYSQVANPPDPLYQFSNFGVGLIASLFGFNDSSITSLIHQASQTGNLTQRIPIYQQIDMAFAQVGSWPQIAQFDAVYATSANVRILPFNPNLVNYFPPILAFQPA